MKFAFSKTQIALAAVAALGVTAMGTAPTAATAAKLAGKYAAGDFHNHTTCSDGSISMQKLVKKSTETGANGFGLDWFVQAGHGGNGNRNCTLTEDASLDTPVYPVTSQGPLTTWQNSVPAVAPKGLASGTSPNQNMWRWQSLQEFQYPVLEYLSKYKNVPLFLGVESVVAGHEHSSMSVITGQIPAALDSYTLPTAPVIAANTSRYTALGNANALAQWEYCFDRNDTDTSRGNATVGTTFVVGGNNWDCAVSGSDYSNTTLYQFNTTAQKLIPSGGTGTGNRGHLKTVEAVKWMASLHGEGSYYVPAHLERAGPFNPNGNNGFNVEHLRNFNNAAPRVAFGFETQPGHGASANRGEYQPRRNSFTCTGTLTNPGSTTNTTLPDGTVCTVTVPATGTPTPTATSAGTVLIDTAGGTTYGGTGIYGAQLGGVWDALLGEGRNFWFFASSDWHNRGIFGPDDRRSTQDFYPGEYQRNYTMVRTGSTTPTKLTPQQIVDGLRTGNNWTDSGQLIDRLAFVACASYAGRTFKSNAFVENLATTAAVNNTDIDTAGCATMGEKLKVNPGAEIVVSVVVRDPVGASKSPYTFANPSLAQIGVAQPLNEPVLHHVDLIRGLVTGYKTPGSADYSGEWPRNTNWLLADGTTTGLSAVPNAAKNTTAAVIKTFNAGGVSTPASWVAFTGTDGTQYLKMTYRIPAVTASQYVRLRGTNLPPAVPFETDASGEPLADVYTNAGDTTRLRIPCTVVGTTDFDGCPAHMATASGASPIAGQKAVSYDVAAWADLWFYSNPIFVEVVGSSIVAGVN